MLFSIWLFHYTDTITSAALLFKRLHGNEVIMKKSKSRNLIICIVAGVLALFGLTMVVMKIAH